MITLWNFVSRHWISIVLIVGALVAVWSVYKHKDKYLMGSDDNK
ncbi:hypothetical protein ACFQZT_09860 [Paenibacillus sp. GCM10027628]